MSESDYGCEYYLSYSGAKLPLNLVSPISIEEVKNRNTFFEARTDDRKQVCQIQRYVYGEVDLTHRYGYDEEGRLKWAEIETSDDENRKLIFDGQGNVVEEYEI